MTVRVSGKNLAIGEALRDHVLARVEAAVGKYFDGSVSGHVTIGPEGSGYRTDCSLHLSSGMALQAEATAHEPYASFEQAAERIEKRLRRYKRRLKGHGQGHDAHSAGDLVAYSVIAAPEDEVDEGGFNPVVIAESTTRLRDLSVAAAVENLDLSGAAVVVFRHATSRAVNIVYRRADGNVGWIDPASPQAASSNGKVP